MRTLRKISQRSVVAVLLALAAFSFSFVVGCASTQPHMQSALDHLNAARIELEAAISTKGGHRERAIELVDQAIHEVEMGMESTRYR